MQKLRHPRVGLVKCDSPTFILLCDMRDFFQKTLEFLCKEVYNNKDMIIL